MKKYADLNHQEKLLKGRESPENDTVRKRNGREKETRNEEK